MADADDRAGRVVLVAAGLLLAYAAARVLQPFISVLAASAIVAVTIHPLYSRLLARLPKRPNVASAIAASVVCVSLAAPLTVGGWFLVRESVHAFPALREQIHAFIGPNETAPPWIPDRARDYLQELNIENLVLENLRGIGAWSGQLIHAAASNATAIIFNLIVFILSLFLFLRDGREGLGRLLMNVPLESRSKARIIDRAHGMVIATVQGVFAVAVLQGLLAVLGLALFGVRFPVLLGALCMLFSPIPFVGPAIVWIPIVARVASQGRFGAAALIALWFALVVGVSDNILRPLLIGTRSRAPVAIVVVGVLGGIRAFGVIGTFLGPVIMAIAVAVVDTLFFPSDHEEETVHRKSYR